MSFLGVYFGPKEIHIVETGGKKLLSHINIVQPSIQAGDLDQKPSKDANSIEMVALFKDALRRGNFKSNQVTLCLSGKDLIVRTFEIPAMPREEISNAINFEIKKYIPFKVEDLIFDYQVQFDKASRTNLVLFVGIKKDTFNRYISLFNQLNFKMLNIEYSAFSALRTINLSGANSKGIVAIVNSPDGQGEDEINFTVTENGFPLFSRDINISATEAGQAQATEGEFLEKLKAEVRVSLDYYSRKLPGKAINRILLVVSEGYRLDLENFAKDIGYEARFVQVYKYIGKSLAFNLNFIKAYAASLAKTIGIAVKINLLEQKVRKEKAPELGLKRRESVFSGISLDPKMIIVGVLVCAAVYGVSFYRNIMPMNKQIAGVIKERPAVATVSPDLGYDELATTQQTMKRRLDNLDSLIRKQLYVTECLNAIPAALPEKIWLTRFYFTKDQNKAELVLEGVAFLGDSNAEVELVNKFLSNLKNNTSFNKVFKRQDITAIDSRVIGQEKMTSFTIVCKQR